MKRFLALLVTFVCLISAACGEGVDYTVATKLQKQLAAGSGFSGTLTFEADTQAFKTKQPVVLDVDYIFVRPEDVSLGEHRIDLALMNGDTPLTGAHVQVLDSDFAFQADVLSPEWYAIAQGDAPDAVGQSDLIGTAVRILSALSITKGLDKDVDAALKAAMEDAITRVDIWIEGYRQSATLGKLDDGTTTMQVSYAVAPSAIKAQVKQMVFDILGDPTKLNALAQALGEDMAQYLNPLYQQWYFDSIDALPLSDDLTITRTVSLEGDTLHLSLKLPLYDSELGAITLCYERLSGNADLPDEQTISLENENQLVELKYQGYQSLTGVDVMQGTFRREITADFAVDADEAEPFGYAFTLTQEISESKDELDRDVYGYNASLTLINQHTGKESEFILVSSFASEERKSAATDMNATLTIVSGDEAVELTFVGESRKKWEPEAVTSVRLDASELETLLPGAAVRLLAILNDYVTLPEGE